MWNIASLREGNNAAAAVDGLLSFTSDPAIFLRPPVVGCELGVAVGIGTALAGGR